MAIQAAKQKAFVSQRAMANTAAPARKPAVTALFSAIYWGCVAVASAMAFLCEAFAAWQITRAHAAVPNLLLLFLVLQPVFTTVLFLIARRETRKYRQARRDTNAGQVV